MEEVNIKERMETEIRDLIPIEEAIKLFESAQKPPEDALKPIDAGKLKGKNEISPLWRMKKMTEMFGKYGDGWKIEIIEKWKEPVESTKEVIVQVSINLYTRNRRTGEWDFPSPAIGSAYLIVKDKNGLHGNENAWASAVTDAIGKACKPFGIGYDVYLGKANRNNQGQPYPNYNNNNYYNRNNNYNNNKPAQQQRPVQAGNPPKAGATVNQAPVTNPQKPQVSTEEIQQNELMKKNALGKVLNTVKELNIPNTDVTSIIQRLFKKNKTSELTTAEMIALSNNLENVWKNDQKEKAGNPAPGTNN